jgi:hypothetical protein
MTAIIHSEARESAHPHSHLRITEKTALIVQTVYNHGYIYALDRRVPRNVKG